MLLRLGARREEGYLASRSRKGCWRMCTNRIVIAPSIAIRQRQIVSGTLHHSFPGPPDDG